MAALDTGEAIFAPAPTLGGRFAAFGKFLLFVLLFAAILLGVTAGLMVALHIRPQDMKEQIQHNPMLLLVNEVGLAAGAVLATVILALAFREPLGRYGFGLPGSRRARDLGLGLLSGFVLLTGLLAAIAALGGFDFGHIADSPAQIVRFGLIYGLLFSLVAVAEEFMMRGYALVQISRAIGFWPAAVILSVLFGAIHAGNAGETPIGLFSAGAIGFVFAYSFYRSGSLMWALGFHAAWDYAQSFIWGVPDSATVLPGALFTSSTHGPEWLTGGAVGPEASWLILPIIALSIAAAHVMLRPPARIAYRS